MLASSMLCSAAILSATDKSDNISAITNEDFKETLSDKAGNEVEDQDEGEHAYNPHIELEKTLAAVTNTLNKYNYLKEQNASSEDLNQALNELKAAHQKADEAAKKHNLDKKNILPDQSYSDFEKHIITSKNNIKKQIDDNNKKIDNLEKTAERFEDAKTKVEYMDKVSSDKIDKLENENKKLETLLNNPDKYVAQRGNGEYFSDLVNGRQTHIDNTKTFNEYKKYKILGQLDEAKKNASVVLKSTKSIPEQSNSALTNVANLSNGSANPNKKPIGLPKPITADSTGNSQAVVPFEPSKAVVPFEPSKAVVPFEPSKAVVPFEPSKAVVPFEPSKAVVPFEPSKTVVPFEPSKTVVPFEPSKAVVSFEPSALEPQKLLPEPKPTSPNPNYPYDTKAVVPGDKNQATGNSKALVPGDKNQTTDDSKALVPGDKNQTTDNLKAVVSGDKNQVTDNSKVVVPGDKNPLADSTGKQQVKKTQGNKKLPRLEGHLDKLRNNSQDNQSTDLFETSEIKAPVQIYNQALSK